MCTVQLGMDSYMQRLTFFSSSKCRTLIRKVNPFLHLKKKIHTSHPRKKDLVNSNDFQAEKVRAFAAHFGSINQSMLEELRAAQNLARKALALDSNICE